MKGAKLFFLLSLIFAFVIVNCSKGPVEPVKTSDPLTEIASLEADVQNLQSMAAADNNPTAKEKHLNRALKDLEKVLKKAETVLTDQENEEADSLYQMALEKQQQALEAKESGDIDAAFGLVRESIKAAKNAIELVLGRRYLTPKQKRHFRDLQEQLKKVKKLARKVRTMLADKEDEQATKHYKKARMYIKSAEQALKKKALNRAEFLIGQARKEARKALKLLNTEG